MIEIRINPELKVVIMNLRIRFAIVERSIAMRDVCFLYMILLAHGSWKSFNHLKHDLMSSSVQM